MGLREIQEGQRLLEKLESDVISVLEIVSGCGDSGYTISAKARHSDSIAVMLGYLEQSGLVNCFSGEYGILKYTLSILGRKFVENRKV